MDEHNNRIFLKQAILDGMSQKYEEEMALNEETADCSKQHYVKMRRILNLHGTNVINMKFNKRALIAILIAAALLLAGCSVYVFHEAIFDFIEEIYDDYIRISYNADLESNDEKIENIYLLHYIPEGYELKEDLSNPGMVYYLWQNNTGETIIFKQFTLSDFEFLSDGENGSTIIFEYNQLKIYCRKIDNSYHYIWSDGYYALALHSSVEWDENEIIKIIDNLEIK